MAPDEVHSLTSPQKPAKDGGRLRFENIISQYCCESNKAKKLCAKVTASLFSDTLNHLHVTNYRIIYMKPSHIPIYYTHTLHSESCNSGLKV